MHSSARLHCTRGTSRSGLVTRPSTSHLAPQRFTSLRRPKQVLLKPSVVRASDTDAPAVSDNAREQEILSAVISDASTSRSAVDEAPEELFYEGSGSNVELGISLLLAPTLLWLPLTVASVGRRLWISYRFTNKRLTVTNTSPLFKSQVSIAYSQIREVRAAPRAFGAWGDMVVFLKGGERLEISGLERYKEIKEHIEKYITY